MSEFDLVAHLTRQKAFSERTFGPGTRVDGVLDHISKEINEVRQNPTDIFEWIDLAMLAFDGAWRAGHEPAEIAQALGDKLAKNEKRDWPDWRTMDPNKAIEHTRPQPLTPVEEGVPSGSGWLPMESAPRDGTRIEGLTEDGDIDLVYWSDTRYCMLGAPQGSMGPGWVSVEAGNLPVDAPVSWREEDAAPGEAPLPVSTDKARIAELEEGIRGAVQHTAILKRDAQDRLDDQQVFDFGRIHGMLDALLNKGEEADA